MPDARAGWLFTARRKALKLAQQYHVDAVLTTGPPHSVHFAGRYVQQQLGIRWIADLRDPWAEIHYNQLLPRSNWAHAVDEHLEEQVLRRADETVVVSRGMADLFGKKIDRDYHVITNGYDPTDFPVKETDDVDQGVIRHVGSISEGSVPSDLLKAMAQLPTDQRPQIEFIGNTHQRVIDLVNRFGLFDHIRFIPYMPHDQAIQKMRQADALLLSIPEVDHNELIVTGKLFDYLGTKRPILCLGPVDGDAAHIISECNIGVTYEHFDIPNLRHALAEIASGQFSAHYVPDESQIKHYSRIALTEKLASVIQSGD